MNILDLLDEAAIETDFFDQHPVKLLTLEEQMLYLQGLVLVMGVNTENSSGVDSEQKNYLALLVHSFELEPCTLDTLLLFCEEPNKEVIISFFETFKNHSNQHNFIFDALILVNKLNDKSLVKMQLLAINKIVSSLKIKSETFKVIKTLSESLENNEKFNEACKNDVLNISQFL